MENTNHYPSPPGGQPAQPDQGQAGQDQAGQSQGGYQSVQPQAGAFYQYQPGVGFVQVQGAAEAQSGMHGQGTPEGAQPKFDQNKLGQMYGVVSDVMDGKADPAKLLGLFAETDGQFWKGALIGAAAVVLVNNSAVKGAVGGLFSSLFGESDPEGEQVTVKK